MKRVSLFEEAVLVNGNANSQANQCGFFFFYPHNTRYTIGAQISRLSILAS